MQGGPSQLSGEAPAAKQTVGHLPEPQGTQQSVVGVTGSPAAFTGIVVKPERMGNKFYFAFGT